LEEAFALLAEMTQDFADALDLETTLERALSMIVAHLGAEAGSLWLLEGDASSGRVVCKASVGPHAIRGFELPVAEGIVGRCVRSNACAQVLDASCDPAFARTVDESSGLVTRSLLCAPLSFGDRALGAIEVVNKRTAGGRFTASDLHPLQVLASSAALAIANARLAAAAVENERVRRELELAAEIQRGLLPAPRPPGFPVFGVNVPARVVSGDFFDFLELADGRIAFCLGDVAGKGMNAALTMAKTASLYHCLARSAPGPGALLAALDREIRETATRGVFVTLVAGILDPRTGSVVLANAGHEPPLQHLPDGSFATLPAQAPPLGILAGLEFPESRLALEGGALYLCSDGLTEACSAAGGALGAEGLMRLVTRFAAKPLAERVLAITAEVRELETRDDLTLLGVADPRGGAHG
jgi:sigma-B regulation protein RsbU (phosphoserine phosphatase)